MREGSRASWLLALITNALLMSGCGRNVTPGRMAPADVLLITLDTTRADALGCYGGLASTPGLDRLADDSLVFDNLFSVGFGTSPSHASLFSSLHPSQHGVHDNSTPLPSRLETLAEVLQRSGYRTTAFVSAAPVHSKLGFDQGFEHFDENLSGGTPERRAQGTVDAYLEWFSEDHGDRPTFAWIHLYDPHQPYDPPAPFAPVQASDEVQSFFLDAEGSPHFLFPEDLEGLSEASLSEIDRAALLRYRGEIAFVDSQIARILEASRARDRYDESLILVVSDHGESFLADGFDVAFRHQELRGSVSRLVGILKLPGNRSGGRRLEDLVGNLDLGPTILDLLELPMSGEWSGRSLRSWVEDETRSATPFRSLLVLEGSDPPLVSMRSPEWAYVQPRQSSSLDPAVPKALSHQLYDLTKDPLEKTNLYGQNPEMAARLSEELNQRLLRLKKKNADPLDLLDDEEHREMLRSLGYLD